MKKINIMILFGLSFWVFSCTATLNPDIYEVNFPTPRESFNLKLANSVPYQIFEKGFDFGYSSVPVIRNLDFINEEDTLIVINSSASKISGEDFSFVGSLPQSIDSGESFQISVRFTPQENKWSEGNLKLVDHTGKEFNVKLTGSSFRQPSDVSASDLSLWLRADRIRPQDVVSASDITYVNVLPNIVPGKESWEAKHMGIDRRPSYLPSALNGKPALYFNTLHHMQSEAQGAERIVNTTAGSTVFIVFKTGSSAPNAQRTILAAGMASSPTVGFPNVYYRLVYFNPVGGDYTKNTTTRKAVYIFDIGSEATANVLNKSPEDSHENPVTANKVYAFGMRYINNDALYPAPKSNFHFWKNPVDSEKMPLGWVYSRSTSWAEPTLGGAHGLIVGNPFIDNEEISGSNDSKLINPILRDTGDPGYQASYQYDYAFSRLHATTYQNELLQRLPSNRLDTKTFNIGANSASAQGFVGYIAEIIVYNKPLTDPEVAYINAYLRNKYQIEP